MTIEPEAGLETGETAAIASNTAVAAANVISPAATEQPEPAATNRDESNNVHDDRDLFEALQVEKPGEL